MVEKPEIPIPSENFKQIKQDRNKELLLKWKELFTALNPEEIKVFIYEDENFPNDREIEGLSTSIVFSRLDGLVCRDAVRLVVRFSGKLRTTFGSIALGLTYDNAFFDSSIREVQDADWLDTLGNHGMITWEKMYEEILEYENARRSEIPELP